MLETVTCKHYPVIEQMKGILKEHGAVNALMSGSGPTVFGIFTDDQNAKEAYEAMAGGRSCQTAVPEQDLPTAEGEKKERNLKQITKMITCPCGTWCSIRFGRVF